jgi:hypothetical protein
LQILATRFTREKEQNERGMGEIGQHKFALRIDVKWGGGEHSFILGRGEERRETPLE